MPQWTWPPAEDMVRDDGGIHVLWDHFKQIWVDIARGRASWVAGTRDDPCDPRKRVFGIDVAVYLQSSVDINAVLAQLERSLHPSPVEGHLRFRCVAC